MIHYTLLPEEEIKNLKWEYRIRLFVALLFFISCALFVGILSIIPSYTLSSIKQVEATKDAEALERSRQVRGLDQIEKDFKDTQSAIKILSADGLHTDFSDIIQNVIKYRTGDISVLSLDISTISSKSTTSVSIVIQGKASTRDALISFKKRLDDDVRFLSTELPISDLAKSKNISFAIRLMTSH